jgi:hypothetical protein
MFKKLVAVVAATAMLLVGTAAFAGVDSGIFSSYKEVLEVQYVDYEGDRAEFAMIQDDLRIAERLRNDGPPTAMIHGFEVGEGVYYVIMQIPFGTFPIGEMTWEMFIDMGFFSVIKDYPPKNFNTAIGFEDIWGYFEYDDEDIEKIKSLIRALNAEDLKQYDGNGVK